MKKLISIFISSILLLGFTGCNKSAGMASESYNTLPDYIIGDRGEDEIEEQYQLYSLEGMSGEDIFNLLVSFSTNINNGDTIDNYSDRFDVKPMNNSSSTTYRFWNDFNSINYISKVEISNIQIEMDGTITIKDGAAVSINLYISDYNIASDLYEQLFQYFKQTLEGNYEDCREGSYWSYRVNDYFTAISMSRLDNGNYSLNISFPIAPLTSSNSLTSHAVNQVNNEAGTIFSP